jgi:GNAT superfamily N-acetyltransferase
MLEIRPLRATDSIAELTKLLHRAYARLGAMGLNYTAVDQSEAITAKRIEGGQCFVATLATKLVGTVVVKPTYAENDSAYFTRAGVAAVHQFAVEPSAQGLGVGKALLLACENWARERGFTELALDTAAPATHLVALYEKWGYPRVDSVQWPGKVYRSVVMSKRLT